MSETPSFVKDCKLWVRLGGHTDLQESLSRLRRKAETIAAKIAQHIPWLTAHTAEHHGPALGGHRHGFHRPGDRPIHAE